MIIENWMSLTSNCYGDAYMNVILCQGMESLGEAFITASGSKALIYYYTGKPIYQRYFFPISVVVVPCEEKTVRWKVKRCMNGIGKKRNAGVRYEQ